MALGYRSLVRPVDGGALIATVDRAMQTWLESKAIGRRNGTLERVSWEGSGVHELGKNASLTVVDDDVGGGRRRYWRFVEVNEGGTWRVTALADAGAVGRTPSWLLVEVDNDRADASEGSDAHLVTSPPRLVRMLLEQLACEDLRLPLPVDGRPRILKSARAGTDLSRALLDERRGVPVIVAGAFDEIENTWADIIADLAVESVGVTAPFVLQGEAFDMFNSHMGGTHNVGRASVRTYHPGVEPGNRIDSVRHRTLTPRTLMEGMRRDRQHKVRVSRSLQRSHAAAARRHVLDRPLPSVVEETLTRLSSVDAEAAVTRTRKIHHLAVEPTVLPNGTAARHSVDNPTQAAGPTVLRIMSTLRDALGTSKVDEETEYALEEFLIQHRRTVRRLQDQELQLRSLRGEAAQLRHRVDGNDFELHLVETENRELRRENEHIIQLIRKVGVGLNYEYAEDSLDVAPPNMEDFLLGLRSAPEITSALQVQVDSDQATALDLQDASGRYAAVFWECCLVLRDYVSARRAGFSGEVYDYLVSPDVAGKKCSIQRFTAREGGSVRESEAARGRRRFPVSTDVSETGFMHMESHFRASLRDACDPRLYFYDDTGGGTGMVHIGYIGILPKTPSNTVDRS